MPSVEIAKNSITTTALVAHNNSQISDDGGSSSSIVFSSSSNKKNSSLSHISSDGASSSSIVFSNNSSNKEKGQKVKVVVQFPSKLLQEKRKFVSGKFQRYARQFHKKMFLEKVQGISKISKCMGARKSE